MRSTIEIDEKLLKQAMALTNAKTKKEAVNMSLEYLVKRKHIEQLIAKLGKFPLDLTLKDLEKMRADD